MRIFLSLIVILIGAAAAAVYSSAFIVQQSQQALVLRFGQPQDPLRDKPGLHWKMPLVDTVEYFDKRILDIEPATKEVIASDQKRLIVNSFARYRIVDPMLVYQRVGGQIGINSRLDPIIESALRRVLGSHTFSDVVRDKREELMKEIAGQVNAEGKTYGLEVVDVRIKRADLPEQNSKSVFERMRAERQRESAEFRAQGAAEANRIRATAEREATVIKAEATRKGEELRGQGDADRNRIFADAFGQDADFFGFYRSMQAYETGLKSEGTRMVISPDSEFFRYFQNPGGTATPPAASAPRP
jgi:membrane protease subunit HflC